MDAMALLCMLHADGPATLKNLRQAGCSTLEAIETCPEERLSKLLGAPAATARRFAREARHLRERLGVGILDREESSTDSMLPCVDASAFPLAAEPEPTRDLVEEALVAWRSLDADDPASSEATEESVPYAPPAELQDDAEDDLPPLEPRARPEFEFGTQMAAAMLEIALPPEPATRPGLVPGAVDGLDPDTCLVLSRAGCESIVDLARADPLVLSRDLGVGYTQLWRLICLANRALAKEPTPAEMPSTESGLYLASAVAVPPPSKLSPTERPWKPSPSILELEWDREIQPAAPPPGRSPAAQPFDGASASELESAGGPFA